jgi:hypothetical protein
MKRLTLFSLAILAASLLFSLPVGAEPTHDARFLQVAIVYELNADGSWYMNCEQRARLDTYYAVNRALGETFIVYNPDFQKLEVLKSETTMADGRKVASPENAYNEVLPFPAHQFADFSHLREMVVTHTGLERGALVDLKYRIHTQAGFLPAFSGREVLARPFPIDEYTLEIRIPASRQLFFAGGGFNGEIVTEIVTDGPVKKYTFRFSDLGPLPREPLAPAGSEPFLAFALAPDWAAALPLADASQVLPAALADKVDKLKTQNPALPEILTALQKIVAVEIRNCGLGVEATGWRSRPLERVVQGNYATRLEKALLLGAMLKKAGIDSELLAVAAGPDLAVPAATPLQLGEFWLKVPVAAAYLDPCHEQHEFFPYPLQGRAAWNFAGRSLEKLPVASGEQNLLDVSGKVQLTAEGASGTLVVAARGMFNRYNEATADHGKFITGILKRIFPVEKAEVGKLLELTRQQTRAEVTFSGKWLKDPSAGFLSMDALRLPGLNENMVILDQRESSLALEAPFLVSLYLDIEPAPELKLEYAAAGVERKNDLGHYARGLVVEKNGRLRFSQECAVDKALIGPEKYTLLRELLLPYFAPDLWLVFKKQK